MKLELSFRALLVIAMAVSAGVGLVPAASAATATGTRLCTGSGWPYLTIDASGAGNGRWTNYDDATKSQVFTFPGGNSIKSSYYQRVNWQVNAPSFYTTPTASCQ